MKSTKIKLNYDEEVISLSKREVDFLFDEFDEFFAFKKKKITRYDLVHATCLHGELIDKLMNMSEPAGEPMRKYIELRLKHLELDYKKILGL